MCTVLTYTKTNEGIKEVVIESSLLMLINVDNVDKYLNYYKVIGMVLHGFKM